MADSGLYVRLDASYYEDDGFLAVSDMAELLYIRAMCLCKRLLTDGHVSRRQVARIAPESDTESDTDLATSLVRAGLWLSTPEGYAIAAWHKWNDTAAEVTAKRRGGELGNHLKWHVKRGVVKPGCAHCSIPSVASIGTDSVANRWTESTETETETETETLLLASAKPKANAKRRTAAPPTFDLSEAHRQWASERGLGVDLEAETEHFLDHHRAKGSLMLDWDSAWRTWMRNSVRFRSSTAARPPVADRNRDRIRAAADEARAAELALTTGGAR